MWEGGERWGVRLNTEASRVRGWGVGIGVNVMESPGRVIRIQ